MAKEEKEFRDVYWVCLKEYIEPGLRITIEKHVYESSAGALKKYEDLILENEGKKDKQSLVDVVFISQGKFSSLKEKHLWK